MRREKGRGNWEGGKQAQAISGAKKDTIKNATRKFFRKDYPVRANSVKLVSERMVILDCYCFAETCYIGFGLKKRGGIAYQKALPFPLCISRLNLRHQGLGIPEILYVVLEKYSIIK